MKFIVPSFFAAALLFGAAGSANAQGQPTHSSTEHREVRDRPERPDPAEMARRRTAHMAEVLQLTDAQRTSIQAIREKYARQMEQLHAANGDADPETFRPKMMELHQKQNAEIDVLLTPEQRATWAKEGEKHGRRGHPDNRGVRDQAQMAQHTTDRMAEVLHLTEAQRAKFQEINLKFARQHAALNNDTTATFEARREKADAIKTQHEAELKSALTPEQWSAWEKERLRIRGDKGGMGRHPE